MTEAKASWREVEDADHALGAGRRVEALDALRGLALCGLTLANFSQVMHMPWIVDRKAPPVLHVLDMTVQQRFFPILALLFGVGFGIFLERAGHWHRYPRLLLLRRLLGLAALGALLQVSGALPTYAIVGTVFLLPTSSVPGWGNLLFGAGFLLAGLTMVIGGVTLVPGLLVLGFAAAQYHLPEKLDRGGRWISAVFVGAVVLSAVTLVWQAQDPLSDGFSPSSSLAGLCMATAYASGFLLLLPTAVGRVLSGILRPLGRMALTNYVTATYLFVRFGHRIGFSESIAWETTFALAAGVLVLQVVWSRVWLAYFRYGPLEWFWRCITWWRIVPLRARP